MDLFNVGDRVRVIREYEGAEPAWGEGTVISAGSLDPMVAVQFDRRYHRMHSCNDRLINLDGYFIHRDYLALVEDPYAAMKDMNPVYRLLKPQLRAAV